MVKVTIAGVDYEGTPKELKELFEVLGGKFQLDEEPLKVGDYAKITANRRHGTMDLHGFEIGEIVRVITSIEMLITGDRIKAETLDGGISWFVHQDDFVKATDEEVAKAKAELKKWAKIGRKPNEFKKGDIVRVKEPGDKEIIGILATDEPRGDICGGNYDLENGFTALGAFITLIAPVESRVDRE